MNEWLAIPPLKVHCKIPSYFASSPYEFDGTALAIRESEYEGGMFLVLVTKVIREPSGMSGAWGLIRVQGIQISIQEDQIVLLEDHE